MLNVAIIFGRYSSEWKISKLSAATVFKLTDRSRYNPILVNIAKKGWTAEIDGKTYPIDKNDFSVAAPSKVTIDVVYNMIHGTPGEDGKILGYLEAVGVQYTEAGYYASALTFHKFWCNQLLKGFDITSARAYTFQKGDDLEALKAKLIYPCFIKPNDSGSSFGVSKVYSADDVEAAIELALTESDLVICEEFLQGVEVSCGVMDWTGELMALPPTEIVSQNDFFDYDAKYNGGSEEITPARISDDKTMAVQLAAKRIFQILNLSGLARVDFIVTQEGPQLIEVNCVPGLSEESIVPKQCAFIGIQLADLVNGMISQALSK